MCSSDLTKDSLKWLAQKVNELKRPSIIPPSIKKEDTRNVTSVLNGCMYFFYYEPKLKEELPYYDKFPLALILEKYNDGFLALNLHYLPFKWRVAFMSKLVDYGAAKTKEEQVARLRITYDILNETRSLREFRPCLKRYLYDHMQSRILAVQPNEWDTALALPIQMFKKESAKDVWADSLNEIRNS